MLTNESEVIELRETVEFLNEQLKNVNLFNSKLIFTFKLLTEENLTKVQKLKIVEAFDRCKKVREVRFIQR